MIFSLPAFQLFTVRTHRKKMRSHAFSIILLLVISSSTSRINCLSRSRDDVNHDRRDGLSSDDDIFTHQDGNKDLPPLISGEADVVGLLPGDQDLLFQDGSSAEGGDLNNLRETIGNNPSEDEETALDSSCEKAALNKNKRDNDLISSSHEPFSCFLFLFSFLGRTFCKKLNRKLNNCLCYHIGDTSGACSGIEISPSNPPPDLSKLNFDSYNELLEKLDPGPDSKTPRKTDMFGFPLAPILPYLMMEPNHNCPPGKFLVCCRISDTITIGLPRLCTQCE